MNQILVLSAPIPNFPNSLTGIYQNGNNIYNVVFWYNNLDSNPRNSLAVMSRITVSTWGIHWPLPVPPPGYQPLHPRSLPWMRVNQNGNLITIYSYHAPSLNTPAGCAYSNPQIAAIGGAVAGVWAVVGDFNADPTQLGFQDPPAGAVVRGNNATQQNGGLLDYSITNAGANYSFSAAGFVLTGSDHFPQNFNY